MPQKKINRNRTQVMDNEMKAIHFSYFNKEVSFKKTTEGGRWVGSPKCFEYINKIRILVWYVGMNFLKSFY